MHQVGRGYVSMACYCSLISVAVQHDALGQPVTPKLPLAATILSQAVVPSALAGAVLHDTSRAYDASWCCLCCAAQCAVPAVSL